MTWQQSRPRRGLQIERRRDAPARPATRPVLQRTDALRAFLMVVGLMTALWVMAYLAWQTLVVGV
jgi:hypothetical protein